MFGVDPATIGTSSLSNLSFSPIVTSGIRGGRDRSSTVGGRFSDALLGFYLRESFQSQTDTVKILYNKSHCTN